MGMLAADGPTSLGYHCWLIVSCISWQHMPKVIGRILSKRTKSGIIGPRILRDSIDLNWGASQWLSEVQVALGKTADFGKQKENCFFSGLAA